MKRGNTENQKKVRQTTGRQERDKEEEKGKTGKGKTGNRKKVKGNKEEEKGKKEKGKTEKGKTENQKKEKGNKEEDKGKADTWKKEKGKRGRNREHNTETGGKRKDIKRKRKGIIKRRKKKQLTPNHSWSTFQTSASRLWRVAWFTRTVLRDGLPGRYNMSVPSISDSSLFTVRASIAWDSVWSPSQTITTPPLSPAPTKKKSETSRLFRNRQQKARRLAVGPKNI